METISIQQPINLKVVRFELDFTPSFEEPKVKNKVIEVPKIKERKKHAVPPPPAIKNHSTQKQNLKKLVDTLLEDLYADKRDWSSTIGYYGHRSTSTASFASSSNCGDPTDTMERLYLEDLSCRDLCEQVVECEIRLLQAGERLARCARARDRLRRQQKRLCAAFTVLLRHITGESGARFGVTPAGDGEGGYSEWLHAMRLVARLPAGVPHHFRKKLWLTLAERHLTARGVDWPTSERACFLGTARPDDTELGAQILKDLHRTGCSLFCGTEGRENQAMLRRVLLAYARWNKEVGYCQGFNMLAAIILEVMEKSEPDSLKVMIYLVEAVLPEGYFADDLRGLSADMAAFRDLLRLRLPRLANHMDHLQRISDGGGVEPPLPDVFTMQWFLTLYATWLQRDTLLRIWDLVLLDGNEVLLLTALAIWDMLQDRILSARSADEYYSCMGGGAGAVWEAGEALVARVVALGSAPELPRLRHLHRYRVAAPTPPAPVAPPPRHSAMQSMTKRGLRLFYSEDEEDSSDDGNKMALATVISRREERITGAGDRLSLDIGALKRQYARLRERQRQAHVILAAACARHAAVGVPTSPTSLTVNNLLLGKSAIVSSRGRRLGPPPGAIPPSRQTSIPRDKTEHRTKTRASETINWKDEKSRKSLSRRNSLKWKDIKKDKVLDRARKASIDLDELGDGVIVSEKEASKICASLRSRSSSETSSYSSHSESSSDTSLCDDNAKDTDSEPELPEDNKNSFKSSHKISPISKEAQVESVVEKNNDLISVEKITKEISHYIKTDAGEPLRTYIGGFETKLKDTAVITNSEDSTSRYKLVSPNVTVDIDKHENVYTDKITERDDILASFKYSDHFAPPEMVRPSHFPIGSTDFTKLSPIDISPCNFLNNHKSPCAYEFKTNFKCSSPKTKYSERPPDIIDSFTMYPNFVPDIDLSDKNISDFESPPRSPGAESIVVSEDEPLIPLKIDKYFEHSPDFFGARITITDSNNSDITSRRPCKRNLRIPKKPDSLNLHSSYNEKLTINEEVGRASSLPQSHSFTKKSADNIFSEFKHCMDSKKDDNFEYKDDIFNQPIEKKDSFSPFDSTALDSGRKNSKRALQIIQENSKILSRILTKQSMSETDDTKFEIPYSDNQQKLGCNVSQISNNFPAVSPLLKESTSDSLIGCRKTNIDELGEKNEFLRIRPISIDDPFSLEIRSTKSPDILKKILKSPSTECLANKTDLYGWENKGFLAKFDYKTILSRPNIDVDKDYAFKTCDKNQSGNSEIKQANISSLEWSKRSISDNTRPSVTLPSSELKDNSMFERRFTPDDYNYPLSNKYNDFVLFKASDICSKTADQGPKICENLSKTDNSQFSDFAHVVTSSISFTYEASAEDDSPIGAKSNSSDTLCQIMSLDQVSTPISPKIFPRDTPTLPKDFSEKSEKLKIETDDTCSTITSLMETETLSSLSYPRSPSTGSYHPFPTRPSMRMPKELGVRLGMYPKETISSPPK